MISNNLLLLFKQKKLRIGVLLGGFSSERKISLKSGRAVAKALKGLGHPVRIIDVRSQKICKSLEGVDFAFIALHGKFGEDGTLQYILEKEHIPYTGSGVKASRNTFDKVITKNVLTRYNIPTASYVKSKIINRKTKTGLVYPVVIKPCKEGSSVGISIVHNDLELKRGLKQASKYDSHILIEQYIKGREVTVGILGETPLPLIEIRPCKDFYSFKAKYQDKRTEFIVKPRFPAKIIKLMQNIALRAYKVLRCSGFSRVDMIYSKEKGPFVLEINTIPGMTERSLLPKAAQAVGIEFPQLCEKIIRLALLSDTR